MGNTQKVSEGLRLLYMGNIVAIIAAVSVLLVLLLPPLIFVNLIAFLVGGVMCLVGLAKLRNEHSAYMSALMACILGIVFGLISNNESVFGSIMNLAQSICSLLQIYFVIQGTNSFLQAGGFQEQVEMGRRAWKWEIISIAVSVAVLLLALTIVLVPLALVGTFANFVVSIIALIFYLSYLKASAAVLG